MNLTYRPKHLFLCVLTCFVGLSFIKFVTASTSSSSMSDLQTSLDISRQVRKTEISRALRLLKKHAIVGKNAKIVLKNSGKHLLIDGSEKLSLIPEGLMTSRMNNDSKSFIQKVSSLKSQQMSQQQWSIATSSSNSTNKSRKRNHLKESFIGPLTAEESKESSTKENIQQRLMENAASRSATIIDFLMSDRMLNEVTRMITTIVRNRQASSLTELADMISESMDDHYSPHWHTIVLGGNNVNGKKLPTSSNSNEELSGNNNQESIITQGPFSAIGIDDHHKVATFYVTFDFGRSLRIFVFK